MSVFSKLFGAKDHEGNAIGEEDLKELYRKCIAIAWPSTVEGALLSIINSVDTIMVSTMGAAAIAAVGLTAQPRLILLIIAQALCVGTTALCARRKGADNREGANACLMQSLALVSLLGVVITLIGYFGADWILRIAGANEDTLEMSIAYFKIISCGFMFNCWNLCICAALRAIGQTRVTMVTNITANLVNVCLNYCLIGGHFGFPALGVRGAAIATVCGSAVACLIAISYICRKNGYYHFALPKFDRITLSGLSSVGSGSILESVCLRLGFLINARLIAGVSTATFAAYQIVSQVTSLSFTLGDGIASAGTALVGQSLGMKRKDLACGNVVAARKISIVVSIALMLIIFVLRRQLALLFTTDEEIIAGVTASFYVVIVGMLSQNARVVYSGCLRGAGDVRFVATVCLFSVTILRPILTWLFCYPLEKLLPGYYLAVTGPWTAFVIDAFVRHYLLYRRIRKGKWLNIVLN